MSRRDPIDVVVVGAGVVGTAAALAAAREGLRVAIVEAQAPPAWQAAAPDLRVYAFAPDNALLLEEFGVWRDVLAARAQPYRQMRVWDAAGGGELKFSADELGRSELGHIVEHGLLVDRLWAAVNREAAIRVYCPDTLQELHAHDDHTEVVLASEQRLRARLVLGADGAASKVRSLCDLETSDNDYGQRGLVAYVQTERPHEATCWQRFLPSGPLAFLPYRDEALPGAAPGTVSSIVWTLPADEAARLLALAEESFRRELTRAFDAHLGEVLRVSPRVAFPLRRQLAKRYVSARVALIGDAAHAVHPLAGQGVNLGLRDVAALQAMWRKALAMKRDIASEHALARWERERRSENAVAAYSFETINRVFSNEAVLPTLLRGHALGLAGAIPPLARFFWKRAAGV